MKKIKVLQELRYKNCPIYIRQLDTRFEYLLINQWKLYNNYIVIKPLWYRWILREKYSEKELKRIIDMLFKSACVSIDKMREGVDK